LIKPVQPLQVNTRGFIPPASSFSVSSRSSKSNWVISRTKIKHPSLSFGKVNAFSDRTRCSSSLYRGQLLSSIILNTALNDPIQWQRRKEFETGFRRPFQSSREVLCTQYTNCPVDSEKFFHIKKDFIKTPF
jgi:hypothetical protein